MKIIVLGEQDLLRTSLSEENIPTNITRHSFVERAMSKVEFQRASLVVFIHSNEFVILKDVGNARSTKILELLSNIKSF